MSRDTRAGRPRTPPHALAARPASAGPAAPAAWSAVLAPARLLDPRQPFLVPLLLLLLARAVLWVLIPSATEDAYITFRYARTLAAGHGLLFNPGERVFGFSSPLWTLWNALGMLVLKNPVLWSRASSLLADVATLLAAGGLLRRHVSRGAAWTFTFFFAGWPYFAAVSVSGMECSLLLALIAVSAAAVDARRAISGPLLAALALTRPEGLAAAAVVSLGARSRERLVALVVTALGLGALFAYYGTIVPQSVVAKSMVYGTPGPWVARYWWEWLLPFPLGRWPSINDTVPLSLLAVVMAPAFVLGLRVIWTRRRSGLALGAAAALGVWAGYSLLGVAYFWWYLAVPLAGVALVAAAGFASVVRGRAVPVACALFVLGVWTVLTPVYLSRSRSETVAFGRAARVVAEQCRPGDKILLEPIGMVGYTAPVVVVDEVGLVSPQVAQRRRQGPGWYTDVERASRPDWLVLRAGVIHSGTAFAGAGAPFRGAAERDSLLAQFTVVDAGVPGAGDGALVVLRRTRAP